MIKKAKLTDENGGFQSLNSIFSDKKSSSNFEHKFIKSFLITGSQNCVFSSWENYYILAKAALLHNYSTDTQYLICAVLSIFHSAKIPVHYKR